MRRWGHGTASKALATIAVAGAILIGQPLTASAAPGPLTITPLGWNIIGLDSNNVTTGPDTFPIGGRVCNTGSNPVTNVGVNWSWLSANANINLANTTSFSTASLGAGACRDYYFNVRVTRAAASYDTTRQFQVTATGDSVAAVSTPTNREVYVEKLVSQNRNAVDSWTLSNTAGCNPATGVVFVGSTCTATIVSKTATNGYEQLVNAYYFNNSLFRIESLNNAYSVPAAFSNTQMYGDACGWNNDRTSGTYRSCVGPNLIGTGKVGGNPITTTITFTVIGTGSQALTGIIYDFSGASYHYNNDSGVSPNILTLTAANAPAAPTAVDDTATTNEDTNVDIDVLNNDSDINGNLNPSSLSVSTQPSNGSASVVGGQIRYVPASNFNGVDTFTYQICDSTAPTPLCATATVTVTVNAVNDPPDAVNDSRTINEDASLTFDPRANDTDPDGDSLTVTGVGTASNGAVSFTGTSVTYTPTSNFNGIDSFTYTISDGNGGTDTATVTVTVNAVNDPPDAVDDSRTINEDASLTFDPRGNDSDPDGNSLTVTGVTAASNGVVSFTGTSVTYTPTPNWSGTDTFTYTIADGNGGSDTATVTVTVNAVNDPPVAVDDADSVDEDSSVTVDVLGNDSDVDDGLDPLSVT
ncbi:MAG: Ig-like domain-containing protein, partial [Actinomycetes bacterium]